MISNSLDDWHMEHVSEPLKRVMKKLDQQRSGMRFVLPLPPSVNAFWRTYKGRMLVSREGRAWKNLAEIAVAAQCRSRLLGGDVQVNIVAFLPDRRRDLDNLIKPALDCLQGAAYANDRQIVRLVAEKRYDKFNPRIEIELTEAA
jgi:crossover junction endodeoxyribonuclease RusA